LALAHVCIVVNAGAVTVAAVTDTPLPPPTCSLEGYAPLMHEAAQQLMEKLRQLQQTGEVVDISAELAKVTLEVVGTCAFG
jgi:hypothetical protein